MGKIARIVVANACIRATPSRCSELLIDIDELRIQGLQLGAADFADDLERDDGDDVCVGEAEDHVSQQQRRAAQRLTKAGFGVGGVPGRLGAGLVARLVVGVVGGVVGGGVVVRLCALLFLAMTLRGRRPSSPV
eukprot:6198202-Pleurochrysis_carterae.AAC.1